MKNATKLKKAMEKGFLLMKKQMKKEIVVYIRQSTPGPTETYECCQFGLDPRELVRIGWPADRIKPILENPVYMGVERASEARKA